MPHRFLIWRPDHHWFPEEVQGVEEEVFFENEWEIQNLNLKL